MPAALLLSLMCLVYLVFVFFFNDTATTEIYTLSLHDALPICTSRLGSDSCSPWPCANRPRSDRKSTRLNSSHLVISYAVFCLKKKKKTYKNDSRYMLQVCIHSASW